MADQQGVIRKLAAILYADVAGYSRLTGADEEGTHKTVADYLDAISGLVSEHGGRVVHYAGDAVLADFPSVVTAVKCAVDIQKELAARNTEIPDDRKVQFRIGVNLGDVIVDRDDIYGNGVNVAARLEGLADPGGICVSGSVLEQVQGKVEVSFEDIGLQEVKNIAKPVQAYRVVLGWQSTSDEPPPLPDKPSIAVLPFVNLSGEADQEFFCDGMAEDIITGLSRYRWFFVIAYNSSFTYKDRPVDVKQIAQDLGVRYLLQGSIRKVGNRMRVSAQLIDAPTGNHIWAERYDRDIEDIFSLQDEITETIVAAIEPELAAVEQDRAHRKRTTNLDAWDSYQRGLWQLFDDQTLVGATKARTLFENACKLDPNFSSAYAELAYTHVVDIIQNRTDVPAASLTQAADLAKKAVSLDIRNPVARYVLGRVYSLQHEYESAISEMEAALNLNPSFDRAYYGLGGALLYSGRPDEGIPILERAIRLNPKSPLLWAYFATLGRAHFNLGRYEEATKFFRKAAQQPFTTFLAFMHAAAALGHLGRIDEAREMIAEVQRRKPDFTTETVWNTLGQYGRYSGAERVIEGLRAAGLRDC